jgi:hypothetical protein
MKTKILRNIFISLSTIFALAITAHAQNLFVTVGGGARAIFEYTPTGVQSTFASGLETPRGLAFDGFGNLFAAENPGADGIDHGKVLKFNLLNQVSTIGAVENSVFEGLATDMAGNAYVMATETSGSPVKRTPSTLPGTIFKFTPSEERIVFGSVPGTPNPVLANLGLAFDSAGNLYAADGNTQTIYKFAPDGTRSVFVGPSAFATGAYPAGLAFDNSGNLFVSIETFTNPGADSIVYFTPSGVGTTFATGLTTPRGLAFDGSGNLFVAECADCNPTNGEILEFAPGGGAPTVFASVFGRPQFLTFGPPR